MRRCTPRNVSIIPHVNPYAHGSVEVNFGKTKVYVTVMVEEGVPRFMKGEGRGWITAEYAMLPSSSSTRIRRERNGAKGRTQEIQRLIGRSLRAAVDLEKLGERTLVVDCDVLVADGGTRTASISGAYVAVQLALCRLQEEKLLQENPCVHQVAALSVGIDSQRNILADLDYAEDSSCETDLNLVCTREGHVVEIQGTAEGEPFSRKELEELVDCGQEALKVVFAEQDRVFKER